MNLVFILSDERLTMTEYDVLKKRLARGWNTWNTRSVLSHVLLPEAFALNLGLKQYSSRGDFLYLKEALVRQPDKAQARVIPGPHTYDGSYSELRLEWAGSEIAVQSTSEGDDLLLLITPLARAASGRPDLLVVESGILWNRPGYVVREGDALAAHLPSRIVSAFATKESATEPYIAAQTPYLALRLDSVVGISTGHKRDAAQIRAIIDRAKATHEAHVASFGVLAEVYAAMQTCLAWDTIYEPEHDRVVSPVSRAWNTRWGGFVLFEWDNYFAAYMAALDNRDLAYANAIEMTRATTERGFVPNFATVSDIKSRDRSEPPVGALVVRELYRRFGDRWLLDEVFDSLLSWNRWWAATRSNGSYLSWGSDPYQSRGYEFEDRGVNEWQGAAWESGLDNSPMWDNVPFDSTSHLMQLADVGLHGLYVMDCEALADIARVLGRTSEATELAERANAYRQSLTTLWHEETGIFLNRRTDSGEPSQRLSPTSFYALLARAATPAQAERMITEHFYNPREFWGQWIMPSIARNDPAYPDQDYWRGRIWGPMNLLVYLSMRQYDLPRACADLAAKSRLLLLKEWQEHGHIHENYNASTGEGCDHPNSDAYYHWGGLLGLISFIENGYLERPGTPLPGL